MNAIKIRVEALRKDIESLRAREEIRNRVFGFARAVDRLDRVLLATQFWPAADVDYGGFYRGPIEGFLDVAVRFQGSMRDTQRLVGTVQITVSAAGANVESYVHAHHTIVQGDNRVQLMVDARYLDCLERRDGVWRISDRTEVVDWGRWLPVPERWFESNRELPKGVRDRTDLSYHFHHHRA